MNEQIKRYNTILCFLAVLMSFVFFYTMYKSEHDAMMRLKVEYETEVMLYSRQLKECYSYRKETK